MINGVALIFILLLFIGLLGRIAFLTYLVFIYSAFSAMSLLPPEWMGGTTLLPATAATLFFIAKALGNRSVFRDSTRVALDFQRMGFLTLFLIVAVIGCYVLPRVFNGSIQIFTMRNGILDFVAPSISNYTQAGYLTLSVCMTILVAALVRNEVFVEMLPKAILVGAYTVIFTGILDLATSYAGLSDVMSYFRTANYVFMADNYVAGTRRLIGITPEASAYGSLAASFCGMLLFLRPAFPPRLWKWQVPLAGWGCGLMAMLSTSTTAYAMMAAVLGLYGLYDIHRIAPDGHIIKKTLSKKALALVAGMVVVLLILVFDRDIATHFVDLLDTLFIKKQESSSYANRTQMTSVAIDAFFASDGMGVGVGTVRASNYFACVLASTGVIGMSLFLMFLWIVFTRRAPAAKPVHAVLIRGSKYSLIPIFLGAAIGWTTPDFGPIIGTLFGLIIGLAKPLVDTKWVSPHIRKRAMAGKKS